MEGDKLTSVSGDHADRDKKKFDPEAPVSFSSLSLKDDAPETETVSSSVKETQLGNGELHQNSQGKGDYGSFENDSKEKLIKSDYSGSSRSHTDENKPLIHAKQESLREILCGTNSLIYVSHFLSAWGDNMWTFAVGLFLVDLTPGSLQLTAAFGLTMGTSVLLFGALIGDWVDGTPRLRAAQVSLGVQNALVVICAAMVYSFLEFKDDIDKWEDWTHYVAYGLIIVSASASNLARIANTIAVEKDWIVEISGADEDRLATMTATMRAIDLTAMIVAPIATGNIMTFTSSKIGALFIAGWNICSFFVEYFLLWKVYNTVPALRKRKDFVREDSDDDKTTSMSFSRSILVDSIAQTHVAIASHSGSNRYHKAPESKDEMATHNGNIANKVRKVRRHRNACLKWLHRLFSGVTIIIEGWKTYARYEVMLSGLSLALLYMTVLGFDNVTVGYAYIQGLTEFEVSLMMGGAGLIGILGTFAYPVFRRWMGLPWTGFVALSLQSATLSMCVVSVWLPGSPFDLGNPNSTKTECVELTKIVNESTPAPDVTGTTKAYKPEEIRCYDLISVGVLMAGIIAARFGLWIADLAITQMFLERIIESERGVVNGVQQSLNQMLDMVKFGLVVALPLAPQFGLLVILSFAFVFSGWILYVVFLCRIPRHMFLKKVTEEKI